MTSRFASLDKNTLHAEEPKKVMKRKHAGQLALYHQLTKCHNLAEVEMAYRSKVKFSELEKIITSADSYEVLKRIYEDDKIEYVEQFIILLLNRANRVLGWVKISQGGITGTVADVRLIFQAGLFANATSIILSHNHPSGNKTPSTVDIELTRKVKEGGKLLDLNILEHLIITKDGYYSFADEGMM